MSPYNTKRLQSLFPLLYRAMPLDRFSANSPLLPSCYTFECGDGWFNLILRLSQSITEHAQAIGMDVRATQVKEKFGEIRFYVDVGDDEIFRLVDVAEAESVTICEVCGATGSLVKAGWWRTRCEACLGQW